MSWGGVRPHDPKDLAGVACYLYIASHDMLPACSAFAETSLRFYAIFASALLRRARITRVGVPP